MTLVAPRRRRLTLTQVVCWQLAATLVAVGLGADPVWLGLTVAAAALLLAPTVLPWHGRWLYQWIGVLLGYSWRRRTFLAPVPGPGRPADDPRRAFLDFVVPGAVLAEATLDEDEPVGLIAHPAGLTAVLEILPDDRTLFVGQERTLPSLSSLLPAAENDPLPTTVQLLVQATPVPAEPASAGLAPESYRALAGNRVPMTRRCWLTIQTPRTADHLDDRDLEPVLLNAVRRTRRRLRREQVPVRLLGRQESLAAIATAARLDVSPPGDGGVYGGRQARARGPELGREGWNAWHGGAVRHTTCRVTRWPAGGWSVDQVALGLPASTVTVGLTVVRDPARSRHGETGAAVVVRVSAADPGVHRAAVDRLVSQVRAAGGAVDRLDGRQCAGLVATLPLGWVPHPADGRPSGRAAATVPAEALVATAGGGGLMLGRDRQQRPVVVRMFRVEPTRVAVVGGLVAAQVLVLRLIALGARVALQTARPPDWQRFVQQTGVGPGCFVFLSPGERLPPPGGGRPEVLVVDIGPVGWRHLEPAGDNRAVMVVRHEITLADQDLLTGADLVVMQPLTGPEAALAAPAVGAAHAESWMARIGSSMVTVVSNGVVRWATLDPTDLEQRMLGGVARFPAPVLH
ncbi:type VII secretion protein EccE [Virgisporangium aurantiacum]|uniref:type VII secretion protein EccE n=1 Tax=Virgisporangium aurantiacum TaxID=175570 RepID=UPI0019511B97|nr:type VII secretion protein EccE [Virgisporangium aurantiacum]